MPARDIPECNICGYELTGLTRNDDCPECGTKVLFLSPRPHGVIAAHASVRLGIFAWLAVFFSLILLIEPGLAMVMFMISQTCAVAGLICSITARFQIGTTSRRPNRSIAFTPSRIGFWLCLLPLTPCGLFIGAVILG